MIAAHFPHPQMGQNAKNVPLRVEMQRCSVVASNFCGCFSRTGKANHSAGKIRTVAFKTKNPISESNRPDRVEWSWY
jgi:hypothetical protein